MGSQAGNELKRKFPRRRFNRQVGFLINGQYHVGQCLEIGEGGLSIVMKFPVELENGLVVNFQVPNASFVSVRAQVKNSNVLKQGNLFLIGCTFTNLQFEHKREIRSYVSARSEAEQ